MRLQSWRRWKWQNQQRSLFVHFTLFSRRSEKSTNLKWENWGTIKVPWPLPDLTLPKMTFSEWCIPIVTLFFCKQKWPQYVGNFYHSIQWKHLSMFFIGWHSIQWIYLFKFNCFTTHLKTNNFRIQTSIKS